MTVSVNGLVVDRVRVEGHERTEGWKGLVKDLAAQFSFQHDVCYIGKPCDCLKPVEWI